jgi:hypothetical protein
MTVYIEKPAVNLREELASLRNQGGYQEQQFYFENAVTNGTFDSDAAWTKGAGWTIGSGVASSNGTASNALLQSSILTVGKTYVVSFDIVSRTAGFVRPQLGTAIGVSVSAAGTYSQTVTCSGNGTFYMFSISNFNGTIDNVSVYETDGTDVIHTMPKGWKPKDVFEDGLLQREGAAHDYEVVYDGFDYFVKPTVAPSATTQTCVIGVKA